MTTPHVRTDFSLAQADTPVASLDAAELIISADSHVMESPTLWVDRLPAKYRDRAPRFPEKTEFHNQDIRGGTDPNARLNEMAVDGVSAEVLYPTLSMTLYKDVRDPELQEACFRVYNDWLAEYCSVAPDRLVGVPIISMYNIDHAIAELQRCREMKLKGAMVWQSPPKELAFTTDHYERFWAAAQEMGMPVSLHIVTGFGFDITVLKGLDRYRGAVNQKLLDVMDAFFALIFSGVMERYPRLKFVDVENEIGWAPWVIDQWDKYFRRWGPSVPIPIDKPPSEYVARQVFLTFFFDQVGGRNFSWWGVDNCMWSNDFPHPNTTWPYSRQVIARDLGHLPPESVAKLVRGNVAQLYGMDIGALGS